MLLVKKYPNRRLYDTRDSRYITLEDLERTIRGGEDIAVQDAQDGRDLTQEILTQIILERGDGKILPAALLMRLIRLDDAALGEFLTRYVSWALDMYMQVKDRTTSLFNRNPLASAPFAAADAIARMALDASPYGRMPRTQPQPYAPLAEPRMVAVSEPPPVWERENAEGPSVQTQMQQLREQIEALKTSLTPASAPKKKAKAAKKRRA